MRGIEHLHSRNVIHRDLKPDNILLQGDFPRITDFGISRIVDESTMSTKAMGSPAYMSPESFKGNKSPQADIWSAGVILYEMLSGDHPFSHETIYGLVNTILEDEPKPLPETFSSELRKIVETALQKDREKRYQTAREMLTAIERASYNLQAKAERDGEWKETLKVDEIKNSSSKQSKTTLPLRTQASKTLLSETQQTKAEKTDDKEIEKTRDARELERERIKREQNELYKIGRELEQNRGGSSNENRKMFLIVGAFLSILLIGGLFWAMSGKSSVLVNNPPENTKTTNSNVNSNKTTVPTAPTGMVYVPGGEFMMGRDDGKSDAEKPAHKVSVSPFLIDVYEMTVQKYKNPDNNSAGLPKVGLNWQEADTFCKKIGKRLPTEEEWEFAARGTKNFIYPWGNDWRQGNANVGTQSLSEVGKFKGASPFGIYDLVGNVWEWTASDFKAYPNGEITEGANLKTIRGGSFEATKDFATTTYRIGWAATGAVNYDRTGFRCVADVK